MLEIKNLSITTNKDRQIVKDLNFSVLNNDKIAIIGEEGNGKSTLLKCIYDKTSIVDYCKVEGDIIKNNLNIGYLNQFLDNVWEDSLIEDFIFKQTYNDNIDYEKVNDLNDIYKLINQVNLNSDILYSNRYIKDLSGGEKVKIRLVKLLLQSPDILLLDEPTNDLDIDSLKWLEHLIQNSNIPVIYVSHDELLLSRTANAIVHLEQINNKTQCRHTFERIGYDEYIEKRLHLIERQTQISKKEHEDHEKQMEKYRHIFERVNFEQKTISRQDPSSGRLLKKKMKSVKSLGKRLEEKELTQRPYVEEQILLKFHCDGLDYKKQILNLNIDNLYIKDKLLSKNISLDVKGKDKVAIIGRNGIGKSTLLKLIYQNLVNREDLNVGYMPQNYESELNNYEYVLDYIKSEYTKEEETLIRTYLGSLKFTNAEIIGKLSDLSGGQKAKLFFVNLIIRNCNVLLLDEPTRNLSPLSNPVIRAALKEYNGAIISVSHDRKYIDYVCDKVYELKKDSLKSIDKKYI